MSSRDLSVAGDATSIIFVATNRCLSRQNTSFATKICLSRQTGVCQDKTRLLRQKYVCRDKHTFVATKDLFCRDKHVFVATKLILVAAPATDRDLNFDARGIATMDLVRDHKRVSYP